MQNEYLLILLHPSICSVVVGTSSRTVYCGLCTGPTFHSCPAGTCVVQRLGSSIGSRHVGAASILGGELGAWSACRTRALLS